MSDLEKVGRFDVLERIGVGNFAVVYRGRDSTTQQPVAIKICIAQDENLRTGFLRLAETAGKLRHPNIVSVLEFGSGDGKPYLVEEYVPSEHLGWRIEGDLPIPLPTRLEYLHQIAAGLEYAHGQGVVHKHVAPRAIRILDDRQAKITDFGIAHLSNATARLTDPDGSSRTDGYIAPEQALGLRADGRTDIFCFGALAYELLTFRKPFSADSLPELFEQVLRGSGPADEDFSGIPPSMASLIRRCLRRDPMERYATVEDLREDLRAISPPNGNGNGWPTTPTAEDTQAIPANAVAHARSPGGEVEDPGDQTVYAGTVPIASAFNGLSNGALEDPGEHTILAERPPTPPAPAVAPASPPPLPAKATDTSPSKAPKPEQAKAPPKTPPKATETKKASGMAWALIAGAVAFLVVIVLGFRFFRSEAPSDPLPPVAQTTQAPTPMETVPVAHQGFLVADARPWGQVQRLLREDGSEAAPAGAYTPLHLGLEPGTYYLELVHPSSEEPQICEVVVVANTAARCWVEFTATSPTDYFKRAGWWR